MSWETFNRVQSPRRPSMTVGIFKTERLSFSISVAELINSEYVELLYDKTANKMALRPAEENSPFAHKVKKSPQQRTWSIGIKLFIRYYQLNEIVQKRYAISQEGNLFVIDLNHPIISQ